MNNLWYMACRNAILYLNIIVHGLYDSAIQSFNFIVPGQCIYIVPYQICTLLSLVNVVPYQVCIEMSLVNVVSYQVWTLLSKLVNVVSYQVWIELFLVNVVPYQVWIS